MSPHLPSDPWVLHSTPLLGNVTDRWIDTQASTTIRYPARLLGMKVAPGATPAPHWLVARRPDRYLAYRGMFRSRGWSPVYLRFMMGPNAPAVVHGHYGPTASGLFRLARAFDSRLVASFYGADATVRAAVESRRYRRMYADLFASAHAVLAEGPAMAARIADLGCPDSTIQVVRLPADAAGLSEIDAAPADEFLVAVAGYFTEKKGFDVALDAYGKALADKADARLMVMGGGPLEGEYRSIVKRSDFAERVEWAGELPFAEFMSRLARARVALYPSRQARNGDSEGGAPVTLIEAQWLGVPSLVSETDDLPFVAAPEGSIVLPARGVADWAEALRALYDEPTRLSEMSRAARQFVRQHHSPEATAAAREAVYDPTAGP